MIKVLIAFLMIASAWALPDKVEIWFISSGFQTAKLTPLPSVLVASNDCVPMGEGCFHPQLGYIEEGKAEKAGKIDTDRTIPDDGVDLIECQDKNYFNIFCANAKVVQKEKFPRIEVWIDNSSSLRVLDPTNKEGGCNRSKLVEKLLLKCGRERIGFSVYNTSIKQLGMPNESCNNYGSNSVKSLMKWINGSEVKKLLIITDLDEHTREFRNYLDSIGAVVRGVDDGSITANELDLYVKGAVASCKKIKPLKK